MVWLSRVNPAGKDYLERLNSVKMSAEQNVSFENAFVFQVVTVGSCDIMILGS